MSQSPLSETIASHIADINDASEVIAANAGAIIRNGWGERMDQAQIGLARARAAFEKAALKANAKPVSEEGPAHD